MFFKIPVKVSDERVVVRASVTTADTVANRAVTSIDTLPELELDVASLAGSVGNGHRHRRGGATPFCSRSGTCRSLSGGMLASKIWEIQTDNYAVCGPIKVTKAVFSSVAKRCCLKNGIK